MALQLKLDELILATREARNEIAGIEDAPDEVLETLKEDCQRLASGKP
jgi:low affinity Fe/Cu permease